MHFPLIVSIFLMRFPLIVDIFLMHFPLSVGIFFMHVNNLEEEHFRGLNPETPINAPMFFWISGFSVELWQTLCIYDILK